MEDERAIVFFHFLRKDGTEQKVDLDIPLTITANELMTALNQAYQLGMDTDNMSDCYLSAEYPTALLRGEKLLKDYHIMNGTKIHYVERVDE